VRASDHTGERHTVRWRLPWSALACLVWVCWSLLGVGVSSTRAQGGGTWTPPVVLSQDLLDGSRAPGWVSQLVVVSDVWGDAHAFWVAAFDEDRPIGDTLVYASWDGTAWSVPVDVLYTPGNPFWIPKAAVDSQGWLHLVWTDNTAGHIWYARAPVAEATSVRAWSLPVEATHGLAAGVSVTVDADGGVHVVYCGVGEHQGVYHVRSVDGKVWSVPVYIGETGETAPESLPECRLGQAVDDRGRLHVVWGQSFVNLAPVYYARSDDGGRSWLPPLEVDRQDEKYYGQYAPGRPNILAIGSDEIHLVWFGAPAGQRWHQWSADGGNTWSAAEQIHPEFRGFTEPPALAADSSGTLHLASAGWIDEGPHGTFYTYWRDGRWSPLALIPKPQGRVGEGGEYTALSVTGGNTLHVVGDLSGFFAIWASSLEVDAPVVPARPRPALEASPTAQLASSASVVAVPTESRATPAAAVDATAIPPGSAPVRQGSSERAVIIGVLPTALLIGLVLLMQLARGRD
jgi:hypothetical protein